MYGQQEQERFKQREAGQKMTVGSQFKAKGHDAVIKAIQDNKTRCKIEVVGNVTFEGVIVARDRYTISLLVDGESSARIFFKQNIVYFQSFRKAQ